MKIFDEKTHLKRLLLALQMYEKRVAPKLNIRFEFKCNFFNTRTKDKLTFFRINICTEFSVTSSHISVLSVYL